MVTDTCRDDEGGKCVTRRVRGLRLTESATLLLLARAPHGTTDVLLEITVMTHSACHYVTLFYFSVYYSCCMLIDDTNATHLHVICYFLNIQHEDLNSHSTQRGVTMCRWYRLWLQYIAF